MNVTRNFARAVLAGSAFGALVLGTLTLQAPRASALPPIGPLCGPTFLWVCSGPGGPDVLFSGTICEKAKFEKKTGKTCVPYSG
ncbi:MAG: hypothetical protein AAF682_05590 [Planctomycetota bacterium]